MKNSNLLGFVLGYLAIVTVPGCGPGTQPEGEGGNADVALTPTPPAAPSGLVATGALSTISLSWTASSELEVTGYKVYRSEDGTSFSEIGTTSTPSFVDTNESSSAALRHGIVYAYRVTAVGNAESQPSSSVRSLYGTRLTSQTANFSTETANSPYVAEGSLTFEGNLTVATGTALYLFDSARLDLLKAKIFGIYGTLRSVAPTTSPVEIAAHAASGSLVDGEGFSLYFYSGCSSYSAADGSGTVLQNATLSNLAANTAMVIECSPRIYNVKATANSSIGVGYLYVGISASTPMIENSRFEKMTLSIASPGVPARTQAFGGGFAIKKNVFSNGFYALYLASFNASSTGFASGQIEGNQFDTVGGTKNVYRFSVAGAADIPLSGNYWSGGTGTPSVPGTSSAGTNGSGSLVFATALSAAPSDVGPTW